MKIRTVVIGSLVAAPCLIVGGVALWSVPVALIVAGLLAAFKPEAVIHFAGAVSVPESVANPQKYHDNNFVESAKLIDACIGAGVNAFIFSSTSAVSSKPLIWLLRMDEISSGFSFTVVSGGVRRMGCERRAGSGRADRGGDAARRR